jgi:hypothetical protein
MACVNYIYTYDLAQQCKAPARRVAPQHTTMVPRMDFNFTKDAMPSSESQSRLKRLALFVHAWLACLEGLINLIRAHIADQVLQANPITPGPA